MSQWVKFEVTWVLSILAEQNRCMLVHYLTTIYRPWRFWRKDATKIVFAPSSPPQWIAEFMLKSFPTTFLPDNTLLFAAALPWFEFTFRMQNLRIIRLACDSSFPVIYEAIEVCFGWRDSSSFLAFLKLLVIEPIAPELQCFSSFTLYLNLDFMEPIKLCSE